jgi:hypothetical protein
MSKKIKATIIAIMVIAIIFIGEIVTRKFYNNRRKYNSNISGNT